MTPIQGELQVQIMTTLWRIEQGSVEQVRSALPRRHQGAYTTIQTVLNRLADRGLVSRTRVGREILYRPKLNEAQYLVHALEHTLSGASDGARTAALAELLGRLNDTERSDVQETARHIEKRRAKRS